MGAPACTPNSAAPFTVRSTSAGLQQLLGGDATAVQAGAAEPRSFDDRDAHAGRRSVERGRVAAGPATEHDEIEFLRSDFCGHGPTFPRAT